MDEYSDEIPILDLQQIVKQSFNLYKSHGQLFLSIGLLYGLANVAGGILIGRLPQGSWGFVYLLNVLITCAASVLVINSVIQIRRKKEATLKNNLLFLQKFYRAFVVVSLAQMFLSAAGLVLFIVPGIYCLVVFIFADILAVVEEKKFIECFQESVALTQGYFWPILLFLCSLAGLSFLPILLTEAVMPFSAKAANSISTVSAVFIAPFLMILQMQLYYRMKEIRAN